MGKIGIWERRRQEKNGIRKKREQDIKMTSKRGEKGKDVDMGTVNYRLTWAR